MTGLPFDPVLRDESRYLDELDAKDCIDRHIELWGAHPCEKCDFVCAYCGFREVKDYRRQP